MKTIQDVQWKVMKGHNGRGGWTVGEELSWKLGQRIENGTPLTFGKDWRIHLYVICEIVVGRRWVTTHRMRGGGVSWLSTNQLSQNVYPWAFCRLLHYLEVLLRNPALRVSFLIHFVLTSPSNKQRIRPPWSNQPFYNRDHK